MIAITSQTTNPYFNLASEEFLLKNCTEEFIFLYRNEKSLIIGKHQNSNLEVNVNLQHELNIPIIRRLSGGGTVFHDLGNLNFCFITNEENQRQVNFDKYAKPMKEALHNLGIEIEVGKRHEFLINNKKISGNASHIWKNRVIHHGTLLFESDTELLNSLLHIDKSRYTDKSVKSVSSEVGTIKELAKLNYDIKEFTQKLMSELEKILTANTNNKFLEAHKETINNLIDTKFKTWAWNYGYNPNYQFTKPITLLDGKSSTVTLLVEKGIITKIEFEGNNKELSNVLVDLLSNAPHSKENLIKLIIENQHRIDSYINTDNLISSLF